jgi:hypothetical protein
MRRPLVREAVRILLLHSADDPLRGPWAQQRWGRVVDLGLGGANAYQRWGESFGCAIETLGGVDLSEYRHVRRLLEAGQGRLMDDEGLDWWELLSIGFDHQIGCILRLRRFADSLHEGDEVFASRGGFHVDALGQIAGREIRYFSSGKISMRERSRHYWSLPKKFSAAQMGGIFWDKYDSDYRIRGRFSSQRTTRARPVVLLPSAYVNVSRMGIRYGEMLPDMEFLLVATRQSGWVESLPSNVEGARLASYAAGMQAVQREFSELYQEWEQLRAEFGPVRELAILDRLGLFAGFPKLLKAGLGIRNAWLRVLETEPVEAVLCCDDTNAHTRVPLILAKQRGLPALTCHHGALDGGHLFKRTHGDVVLAKGRMEHDYLTRVCGVREDQIEIGGPPQLAPAPQRAEGGHAPSIVFFSEPYEVFGGRTEEFYRDLIPPLAKLAEETGRELVVKLHPMESARERRKMIERVEPMRHARIRVASGALNEELLQRTWFAVTVLSTAAMDCALRGVPCFLCEWLEYFSCGYSEQFCKFGAGVKLRSPADIAGIPDSIPKMLEAFRGRAGVQADLSSPIAPARLRELLSGKVLVRQAAAV